MAEGRAVVAEGSAPAAAAPAPAAVREATWEDCGPESGVAVQAPERTAPALVDVDGLGALPRPRPPPLPAVLLWRHLSCADVRSIRGASSLAQLRDVVGLRCPEVLHASPGSPAGLLLEMLLYVLQYARERELSEQQTSVVFSVAKVTHEYATSTCFGNVTETFGYFRDLLAAHCVNRPPWSLDLFEPAVAEHFARFFADMYFRHFSLVKAAFTRYVTLDVDIWYEPRVWRSPEELACRAGAAGAPAEGAAGGGQGRGDGEGRPLLGEQRLPQRDPPGELRGTVAAAWSVPPHHQPDNVPYMKRI
ncbi:Coiled-coil domain-containing protein 189 [Amphibalanus amphitrite]|uniref:Coiled-coil domain-containing protein 189 n=1 Tax=Amphibalanus amphitrite TaxID=1232801 RepID=A0A6A4W8A1_AMPAM|nr:Coiled-coil domain-containing protein 189 [Amphibalanus amphitrite]